MSKRIFEIWVSNFFKKLKIFFEYDVIYSCNFFFFVEEQNFIIFLFKKKIFLWVGVVKKRLKIVFYWK